MPAITVEDTSTLERLETVSNSTQRRIRSITEAPKGFEGEDFPVRRASRFHPLCLSRCRSPGSSPQGRLRARRAPSQESPALDEGCRLGSL